MKKLALLAFMVLLAVPLWGQTTRNGTVTTGLSTALPATCSVGDQFNSTDTGKIYVATLASPCTWTIQLGVPGPPGPPGPGGLVPGTVVDANYVPISTAANAVTWEQIASGLDCLGASHALGFTASTHQIGCNSIASASFPLTSTTANPATVGTFLRSANSDTWGIRNWNNSANCIMSVTGAASGNNPADLFTWSCGGFKASVFSSGAAQTATAGLFRLTKNECVDWENNANNAPLGLCINGSDNLTFGGETLAFRSIGNTFVEDNYFNSGIPSFDVRCVNDRTLDTAAAQAAINLARPRSGGGEVNLWGDMADCALNSTLDLTGGIMSVSWLVIHQHALVHVYGGSIMLPSNTLWHGGRGGGANASFNNSPQVIVDHGDGTNAPLFNTGTVSGGVAQVRAVILENLSILGGNAAAAAVHFYAPIQCAIRYSTIDSRVNIPVVVDQPGEMGGSGFGFTLWSNTLSTGVVTPDALVFKDTDTGNVTINGDLTSWFTGGGLKFINDITEVAIIQIGNVSTENLPDGASFINTDGALRNVAVDNISFSDNIGAAYLINTVSSQIAELRIGQQLYNFTALFAPGSLPAITQPFSSLAPNSLSAPFTNTLPIGGQYSHLSGLQDDMRRGGAPTSVRFANLNSVYAAGTWAASCEAGATVTTGVADFLGGTAAVNIAASGTLGCDLFTVTENPPTVGEIFAGGVWARATTGAFHSGSQPLAFTNAGSTLGGWSPGSDGQPGGDNAWHWVWFARKVTTSTGSTDFRTQAIIDASTAVDYYAPITIKIPAGTMTDAEAIQLIQALAPYPPTCSVAQRCNAVGQAPLVNTAQTWTATQTFTKTATAANCGANGSAANPSLVACTSAAAGGFSCDPTASTGTCVVSTTAVTANSEVVVQQVSYLGTRLSVTCNTASALPAGPLVTAISAGASFTLTLGTVTTNPACFVFTIVN